MTRSGRHRSARSSPARVSPATRTTSPWTTSTSPPIPNDRETRRSNLTHRLTRLATLATLALALLGVPSTTLLLEPAFASHSPSHFLVSRSGNTYRAESSAVVYTGSLKTVVETAVSTLNSAGGGTVEFTAGDFDLGSEWFRLIELHKITFAGQGMDVTTIRNYTTVAQDTEPFNFKGAYFVTIRDLTVAAGGTARNTSDAIDFDKGNDSTVERVHVATSRGKGIIFDGKNKDGTVNWTSLRNTVRDCVVEGATGDGIQFLASSENRVRSTPGHDSRSRRGTGCRRPWLLRRRSRERYSEATSS